MTVDVAPWELYPMPEEQRQAIRAYLAKRRARGNLSYLHDLQEEMRPWFLRNFGEEPTGQTLLGLVEEVGEACRADLKRTQGIRGTRDQWTAELRKELGDVFIKLVHVAVAEGVDLQELIEERWAGVSQRNWVADKVGHGLPEAETA